MHIRLDTIGADGLDVDEAVSTEWLKEAFGSDAVVWPTADGRLLVHLMMVEDVVHVRGKARVALGAECSRCVRPMEMTLEAPLEVALFPEGRQPEATDDGELGEEDLGVSTYSGREVSLVGVVRDGVLLAMPMVPLCKEDCAGLCDQCGENLNSGACICKPKIDERLAALKNVKLN